MELWHILIPIFGFCCYLWGFYRGTEYAIHVTRKAWIQAFEDYFGKNNKQSHDYNENK
jgi:hypothetical protein